MLRAGAKHPDAGASSSRGQERDHASLYESLDEYLHMEPKFQANLCLPTESETYDVVTTGARDGAAHVLRCLKVWYDLPTEVLIDAITLFDRFLTKIKVRSCHLPCTTVACMNIAIEDYAKQNNVKRNVSIEELVSISQSRCTAGDVERMSRIVVDKLALSGGARLTPLHWLRLLRGLMELHVEEMPQCCQESELINLLEIVACDATCVNARTSELALVILYYKLEQQLAEWLRLPEIPEHAFYPYKFKEQVQRYCHMSDRSVLAVHKLVKRVVSRYEARAAQPHRQRLVWRLSERTLKVLRPTDRLTSLLPTIEEQHYAAEVSPPRNRSGSESSENEETSDWPRSPVVPVYCDV